MTRRFTRILAAFALLVFMTPSLAGWGQTRDEQTVSWTASSGALGSGIGSGTINTGTYSWDYTRTLISGVSYTGWTSNCIQLGKNGGVENLTLSTSNIPGIIKSVSVECASYSAAHKVSITVGGTTYLASTPTSSWTTVDTKTGTGNSSGQIIVSFTEGSRALYIKSLSVIYEEGPVTYTVTYDGNGADQGTVPTDNNEYDEGDMVTVLGPGTMAKTGHTFEWWEDAEGTPYEEDETFEIYENTTLTAQWSVNTYDYTLYVTGDDGEAMAELKVDGSTVATGAKIAYNKEVTVVVATNDGYRYSIAVEDADHNAVSVENDKFTMPASNVTVTVTTTLIPTYTISFDAGTGTAVSPMNGLEGSSITLPTTTPSQACASRGWTFAGWAASSVNETTTAPTLLSGEYTITGNATLYAVYQMTEGDGGSFEYDFSQQGYTNGQAVYSGIMDATSGIGWAATAGSNPPAYYNTGSGLRVYNGGTFKVTANNNTITAVSLTFDGSYTFTSNADNPTTWSGSQATDITWNVGQTCRLQKVNVTYGLSTTTYNSNPDCLEKVATPVITLEEGIYAEVKTTTITCATEGATIYYTTDGTDPTTSSIQYTIGTNITIDHSMTLKAIAVKEGMDNSEIATATYTIQYTLTVDIDDDLVEYFLFDYTNGTWVDIELDDEGQALVSSGADVRISGGEVYDDCYEVESFNVTDGNSPIAVNYISESMEYSFTMPASNATLTATLDEIANHYTLTVEGLDYVDFDMLVGSMSSIITLDANHQASICEESEVTISELTVGIGHVLESVTLVYGNQTTEITPTSGVYVFEMPSSNATLTFTTGIAPTYTHASSIISGKSYIIVGFKDEDAYAMGGQRDSNRGGVGINVSSTTAFGNADVHEVVITALEGDDAGKYTIEDGGFLYAASSTGNQLKTKPELDNNGKWTIEFDNDGKASIVAQGSYTRKYMRFNINNNSPIFSCYASISDLPKVYLYEKDETPATETFLLDIDQYTSDQNGWYLIASPVAVDLLNNPMVQGTFDLYRFNPTADLEWENYKNTDDHSDFTTLEVGRGYLYANGNDGGVQLSFTGVPSNNGEVTMPYVGWNLVGNPLSTAATITNSYYKMNDTHSGIMTELVTGGNINVLEAVFVQATEVNQTVTFTPAQSGNNNGKSAVEMNLSQNRGGVIDRAIVCFGSNNTLPKFQLFENSTKIYIAQDGEDYAIVNTEAQGEMPVNFRANEDGQYILTVNPENVDMNYLHLIDNMTGMDIDLLQTPSYTFNATTRDYESRFRLVFAANNEDGVSTGSTAFAFFSNGNWIINNAGEATLQVIDVTGRVLSSETVSGSVSKTINAVPGVYMLRLINGENVNVQKIVVR